MVDWQKFAIIFLMSSKRKREKKEEENQEENKEQGLNPESHQLIFAVSSFAFGVIFALAAFGKAGLIGGKIYAAFDAVFGKGFFILPLVFFLMGFSFFLPFNRSGKKLTVIGGGLFFLSTLALADLLFGVRTGGYVGYFVSLPLFKFFGIWASLVILLALFIISLVLILRLTPAGLKQWLGKKENEEDVFEESPVAGEIKIKPPIKEQKYAEDEKTGEPQKSETESEETIFSKIFSSKKISVKTDSAFNFPPLDLFSDDRGKPAAGDIKANSGVIKRTLHNFGIEVEMGEVNVGPSVARYTLRPAQGIKLSRITALHNDLALALAAHPLRIEAPIPGQSLVGIEIPNRQGSIVGMRGLLGDEEFQKSERPLLWPLGRDVTGRPVFADLAKMPHLLIAGSTGSGKSISMHTFILSLLYKNTPSQLRFIIIDPKRVELTYYSNLPHLLAPVITESKKAILALKWAVSEMDKRYDLLSKVGARDIGSYQKSVHFKENPMPYTVIVIDELADLMASYPREMESLIIRLSQMARAVGLHLVVSTQRPSIDVITGLIKANITNRIALQVVSQFDSRTILDMSGAEKLLGKGDMLFLSSESGKPRRIQGAYVSEAEIKRVVQYLEDEYEGVESEVEIKTVEFQKEAEKNNLASERIEFSENDLKNLEMNDELYPEAETLVLESGKASASYLQRRLSVGYARAARLLDLMEERGIIGPSNGAKPREILISKESFFDKQSQ